MSDTGIIADQAYVAFGGTALQSNYRNVTFDASIATVDQSAGSDAGITRLTTLLDGAFSLTVKRPASGTTNWESLTPGVSGTFEVGPEGTASNKPRAYAFAILTQKSVPLTYNDIVIDTYTFEMSDVNGVTWTNY